MRIVHKFEELLIVGLFVLALAALTAQLGSRYFLDAQFPWTEELARFCFTWTVFLGAAYAMRTGGLIAVHVLVDIFPDRMRTAVSIAMHLMGAVFFFVVAWVGTSVAIKVSSLPTIAMGISSAFEYGAVPVASLVMGVRSVREGLDVWKHGQTRHGAQALI